MLARREYRLAARYRFIFERRIALDDARAFPGSVIDRLVESPRSILYHAQ
jgi:hypothetical protein